MNYLSSIILLCVSALLYAPHASAQARIWIVDSAGNGDFTDLPPALAASSPGDAIQIEAGSYSGGTIPHPLSLLGRGTATRIAGRLVARGLQSSGVLLIQDLFLERLAPESGPVPNCPYTGSSIFPEGGLRLFNCTIPVHVRGVTAHRTLWTEVRLWGGGRSLVIETCARVTLENCEFTCLGGRGETFMPTLWCPSPPPSRFDPIFHATRIVNSNVVAHRCRFLAMRGEDSGGWCDPVSSNYGSVPSASGGSAIQLGSSNLALNECELRGGDGGNSHDITAREPWCVLPCEAPAPGGNAITIFEGACRIEHFASSLLGGLGGTNRFAGSYGCPPISQAANGVPIAGVPQHLYAESSPLPALERSTPLRVGALTTFTIRRSSTNATLVMIAGSWQPYIAPSVVGLTLFEALPFAFPLDSASSVTRLDIPLENDALLIGFPLFLQVLELEPQQRIVRLGPVSGGVVLR